MAESYQSFQATGPQIDQNLFINASSAGIAAGNAQKTPFQAAVNGLISGAKEGLAIVGAVQGIQAQGLANDAAAAKNQTDTDPAVVAARTEAAKHANEKELADIAYKNAEAAKASAAADPTSPDALLKAAKQRNQLTDAQDKTATDIFNTLAAGRDATGILDLFNNPKVDTLGAASRSYETAAQMYTTMQDLGLGDTPQGKAIGQAYQTQLTSKQNQALMKQQGDAQLNFNSENEKATTQSIRDINAKIQPGDAPLLPENLAARAPLMKMYRTSQVEITGNTVKLKADQPVGSTLTGDSILVEGDKVLATFPVNTPKDAEKAQETYNTFMQGTVGAHPAATAGALNRAKIAAQAEAQKRNFTAQTMQDANNTLSQPAQGVTGVTGATNETQAVTGLPAGQVATPPPSDIPQEQQAVGLAKQAAATVRLQAIKAAPPGTKEAVAAVESIPALKNTTPELKTLAFIESAGKPDAVSHTGPKGLFQFTEPTWKDLQTIFPDYLGNKLPTDPEAATFAANYLFAKHKADFQYDIHSALVAYNAGPGIVIAAQGLAHSTNYADYSPYIAQAINSSDEYTRLEQLYADSGGKKGVTKKQKIEEVKKYVEHYDASYKYFQ